MKTKTLSQQTKIKGGLSDENKRITRAEKRKLLGDFNACCELYRILRRFFPDLLVLLRQINDPRHQSYVIYKSQILLYVRILAAVFHIGSMRKFTKLEKLNIEILAEMVAIAYLHWQNIKNAEAV